MTAGRPNDPRVASLRGRIAIAMRWKQRDRELAARRELIEVWRDIAEHERDRVLRERAEESVLNAIELCERAEAEYETARGATG